MLMDWIKKVTDIIMPLEPLPEEDIEEEKKSDTKATENKIAQPKAQNFEETSMRRMAVGGGTATYAAGGVFNTAEGGTTSMNGMRYTAYSDPISSTPTARPSLTVVKSNELTVKIYAPENFNQVVGIADDILGKKAAVVNYELVGEEEQRRISDFVNGVCYVTDGAVSMVSEKIFLYLPAGVESGEIARAASSVRIR